MNCVKPAQPTSGSTSSRNVRPMPASSSGCVAKLTVNLRSPSAGVSRVGRRRRVDDERDERIGAVVLDRVRLAGGDVGRRVGRQLVVAEAVEVERRRAREHEHRLLVAGHRRALRAADREAARRSARAPCSRTSRRSSCASRRRRCRPSARTSACCTRCPGISSPRAPARPSSDLAGVILEVLLLGRPGRAHDRVAVEQQRDAAGELAVLAVVLDRARACSVSSPPVSETSGKRRPSSAAKQRWLSSSSTLTPTSATFGGLEVVDRAVELDRLHRAASGCRRRDRSRRPRARRATRDRAAARRSPPAR